MKIKICLMNREVKSQGPKHYKIRVNVHFFSVLYLEITRQELIKTTKGTVVKLQSKPNEIGKLESQQIKNNSRNRFISLKETLAA